MTAREIYLNWLERIPETDELYMELLKIHDNDAEITDRFYQDIEFGTAGLRGICAAGTNRMNRFTVGRATQGIANYILKSGLDVMRGVVIAYDPRHFSKEFSEMAAEILAGNGIKAYIFPSLRPTPELSFALRKLNCVSGINMTASHNPKEYNGYKVYWEDGAQISGEVSNGMLKEIKALDLLDEPKRINLKEGMDKGLITMLSDEMDKAYLDYVVSLSQRGDNELDKTVSVVYTPLNGAGAVPMMEMAALRGFENFKVVPEQRDPDPDFTTAPYPNPENPAAFGRAEVLGKEVGAEVLIATDPDSDRMAIEIADGKGGFAFLNGNQTGGLIINYMAEAKSEHGSLKPKSAMIKSIVTGDFGRAICEDRGITVFESLTGFKNICGLIDPLKEEGYDYFFGYEESIGVAPGEAVRDKDGVAAGMLITEMAAYYKKQGKTLLDVLGALYEKYGYFAEDQVAIVLKGKEGGERIGRIMDAFREGKPEAFGEFRVAELRDFINGYQDIPAQNCMIFKMTDGSWFAMRPSGTEPKIKFYFYTVSESSLESARRIRDMIEAVQALIDSVE